MVDYTSRPTEYTVMVLVYGDAAGYGRAARRIYQKRYPHRVAPLHTLFAKVIQRLRERGTFTVNRADCGAPRRRRTPNFEENEHHRVEQTPSTSTRIIARRMGVPHSTVSSFNTMAHHPILQVRFVITLTGVSDRNG